MAKQPKEKRSVVKARLKAARVPRIVIVPGPSGLDEVVIVPGVRVADDAWLDGLDAVLRFGRDPCDKT